MLEFILPIDASVKCNFTDKLMVNKHKLFFTLISSFLDGVKLHLPKRLVGLARSVNHHLG